MPCGRDVGRRLVVAWGPKQGECHLGTTEASFPASLDTPGDLSVINE